MALNKDKSYVLYIPAKEKQMKLYNKVKGIKIVHEAKYLGIWFDDKLRFKK